MNKFYSILKSILIIYTINITFIIFALLLSNFFNFNLKNIKNIINKPNDQNFKIFNNENNIFWANEIINGGYILYFRHAERNKLQNLKAFDGLEMLQNLDAENTFFSERSCLNQNGKVEAKVISKYFKMYNIKYSKIISSPSCRARQTAMLAFNRIDEKNNLFMYLSPFVESIEKEKKNYQDLKTEKIREYLLSLNQEKNQNIIVVGHKGIILPTLIENKFSKSDLQTLEAGFVILQISDEGLLFKYKFNSFEEFTISLNSFKLTESK